MIVTKNWVRVMKFEIIKKLKIGLEIIFPILSATETTTIVAPSTNEFPGGGGSLILLLAYLSVLRTMFLSSGGCKFHQKIQHIAQALTP